MTSNLTLWPFKGFLKLVNGLNLKKGPHKSPNHRSNGLEFFINQTLQFRVNKRLKIAISVVLDILKRIHGSDLW